MSTGSIAPRKSIRLLTGGLRVQVPLESFTRHSLTEKCSAVNRESLVRLQVVGRGQIVQWENGGLKILRPGFDSQSSHRPNSLMEERRIVSPWVQVRFLVWAEDVAQLVRASVLSTAGSRFKSWHPHHILLKNSMMCLHSNFIYISMLNKDTVIIKQRSRAVKGGGLKILCVSFVGSNPTATIKGTQFPFEPSSLPMRLNFGLPFLEKRSWIYIVESQYMSCTPSSSIGRAPGCKPVGSRFKSWGGDESLQLNGRAPAC